MTGTVAAAISDEQVLQQNSLASVTPNFIVVRNQGRQAYTIIPLARVSGIEMVKTPYPGLLVISIGMFVVAAAAFFSKEGDGAGVPIALLGLLLLVGYFGSRRASVTFFLHSGTVETITGGVAEAAALVSLIEFAQQTRSS